MTMAVYPMIRRHEKDRMRTPSLGKMQPKGPLNKGETNFCFLSFSRSCVLTRFVPDGSQLGPEEKKPTT
jgi:hypothetical protein